MCFGEKLRKLRKERGMTQVDVVDAMGVNPVTNKNYLTINAYVAYEQRNVRPRHKEIYERLAEVLNCEVEFLLDNYNHGEKDITNLDVNSNLLKSAGALLGIVTASAAITPIHINPITFKSIIASLLTKGSFIAAGGGIGYSLMKILNSSTSKKYKEIKTKELIENIDDCQSRFGADSLRIIQKKLTKENISYELVDIKELNLDAHIADDCLITNDGKKIIERWFVYWAKTSFDDENQYKKMAQLLISNYALCKIDKKRKISIVVDDIRIYKAIVLCKNDIGLNANMSAILINREKQEVEKEENISICK